MPMQATKQRRSGSASPRPSRLARPTDSWLLGQLRAFPQNFPRIVRRACANASVVRGLLAATASSSPPVKFGSAKALWLLAEAEPALVYPHFDFFVKQLDAAIGVFRWNAARTLASLAPADTENRLEPLLDKYLGVISGPHMIDAANVIGSAWKIACARPRLANRIARAILGVSQAEYRAEECRNVAAGHALQSLGRFFDLIEDRAAVLAFARAQQSNSRPATRRKAEDFLKELPAA